METKALELMIRDQTSITEPVMIWNCWCLRATRDSHSRYHPRMLWKSRCPEKNYEFRGGGIPPADHAARPAVPAARAVRALVAGPVERRGPLAVHRRRLDLQDRTRVSAQPQQVFPIGAAAVRSRDSP